MFETLNPYRQLLAEKEQEEAMLQEILKKAGEYQFCIILNDGCPFPRFLSGIRSDEVARFQAGYEASETVKKNISAFKRMVLD